VVCSFTEDWPRSVCDTTGFLRILPTPVVDIFQNRQDVVYKTNGLETRMEGMVLGTNTVAVPHGGSRFEIRLYLAPNV
jgi:hypothetical protein